MATRYVFIDDESAIKEKINTIDSLFKKVVKNVESMYYEDLIMWSAIDKSLKLIDSFVFALERHNVTVLAILCRVQLDSLLRAYSTTLVKDSGQFSHDVLVDKKRIDKICDMQNNKMTDKYLCQLLGKILNINLYDFYQKISGFVHLSYSSFHNMTSFTPVSESEQTIRVLISRQNNPEKLEKDIKDSIVLANQFYFFAEVLINDIYQSWITQKVRDNLN